MLDFQMVKQFLDPMIAVYLNYGPFAAVVLYLLTVFVIKVFIMLLNKTYKLIDVYTDEVFGAWTQQAVGKFKKDTNKKNKK